MLPPAQRFSEAKDIRKRWQEYTEELYKKDLHDPDNHDDVITNLEPDILECEECSNYLTIALISHTSKFSKPGFTNTSTVNFQMFKLNLENVEEPEIKLPTSVGPSKMIMASGSISLWQIDGETRETETLFSWAPKSLQMVTAAMKLKDACSLEEKV